MTLTNILIFTAAALLYLALVPRQGRAWALYAGSIVAIYWLQPAIIIRWLDFIFPTLTLALVVLAWAMTRAPDQRWTREDTAAALVAVIIVLALSAGRYIVPEYRLTASSPPAPLTVLPWLIGAGVLLAALWTGSRALPNGHKRLAAAGMLAILALFIVYKTEPLAEDVSRRLRAWEGRPSELASAQELAWLGFSYVAFRLIHTLRDRQSGRLPALGLRDYVTYALFFPAFTAGPIDRAERHLQDAAALPQMRSFDADRLVQGGMRIAIGVAKKFVIADSLAYMALDAAKADQTGSTWGLWVLLYAYAFQIYFDFSGLSDIAIGIGQLVGIKLPENFNQPYLKRNITLFWQSWHITLSQWVRFYVFSPLSRYLLTRKPRPSPTVLALVGQVTTMIVIGLWHGVTVGFIAWGLWHGIGLFVHKVYSDRTRRFYIKLRDKPRIQRAMGAAGIVITFHFVALGWVWFAIADSAVAWDVLGRLFGL